MQKEDFIGVYEDQFGEDFCKFVIEEFEKLNKIGLTKNRQQNNEGNSVVKDDSALFLSEIPADSFLAGKYGDFVNIFWSGAYRMYAEKSSILQTIDQQFIYSIKVQKTQPGQGYHVWHCEAGDVQTSRRVMAFILYLNDVDEGGETEFLHQSRRIKAKAGTVVLWPAAYTHVHRGNPPLSGDKYILTGWVEF